MALTDIYVESLITPHPRKNHDEIPQSLLAVVDPEYIREHLQGIDDVTEHEEEVLVATDFIAQNVRDSLWYPEKTAGRDDFEDFDIDYPVPLEALKDKQVARCFGFTIITSKLLDMSGIDHWIGFMNGHSVILLPSEGGNGLHMFDPLSPELNQNLRFSLVTGDNLEADMTRYKKSAIQLNTMEMARNSSIGSYDAVAKFPWLRFRRNLDNDPRQYFDPRIPENPNYYKGFMSVYLPEDGRRTLYDYNRFRIDYLKGDYVAAVACLKGLRERYPDVDARRKHPDIKQLATHFASNGQPTIARAVVEMFFNNFKIVSNDSRFMVQEGDMLYRVAVIAGDIDSAQDAVDAYDQALMSPKAERSIVEAKLGRAAALLATLEDKEKIRKEAMESG